MSLLTCSICSNEFKKTVKIDGAWKSIYRRKVCLDCVPYNCGRRTSTKRSVVWTTSDDEFKKMVEDSNTLKEILEKLGLDTRGGNYRTLNKRLKRDNIDTTKMKENLYKNRNVANPLKDEEIFCDAGVCRTSTIRRRIVKKKIFEYKCSECNICEWNGKELSLELDHIDGNPRNNCLKNLRFLCPNCHSQTVTWKCRKRKLKYNDDGTIEKFPNKTWAEKHPKNTKCKNCNNMISEKTKTGMCQDCYHLKRRKTERPSYEVLKKEIDGTNYCAVGRKYGVSDNAIRKWIKTYEKSIKI